MRTNGDEWLTTTEAATILQIGEAGVRWLISENRLRATKKGRQWLIRRSEVERYQRER